MNTISVQRGPRSSNQACGLRVGTGPRGHYIHAGRGGVYYRASIGHAGENKGNKAPRLSPEQKQAIVFNEPGVNMVEVESGDVLEMRDEAFGSILDEINTKQKKARMSLALPCLLGIVGLLASYATGAGGLVLVALAVPAWAVGRWIDSFRRATVLFYDLADDTETAFQRVTAAFDGLMACAGKWHVEAGGVVRDLTTWKRNAGASHLIKKKPTVLVYKLPKVVKSNITPPALHVGRQIIYFFPDIALIQDGDKFGAVGYADLKMVWQNSNFIEEGTVPRDAKVISHTWQHPNKKGGPDRRFRNNKQIPVCLYEAMYINSNSGINELVEFSRTGVSQVFASAVTYLPRQSVTAQTLALPSEK